MVFKDTVAIVTGASSGIGLATAKLLSQRGANVILVSRNKEKLETITKQLSNSVAIPTDMTNESQIKSLVQQVLHSYGRIDILINSAGQGYDATVEHTNIETTRKIFELDFIGPLIAMKEVIPVMKKQKNGVIVNVSSGTALMLLPDNGIYSSIKQALAKLSLTARMELANDNIAVSVVYPYMTATSFEQNTIKAITLEPHHEEGGFTPPSPDSAEFVAEKILEGIENNTAEVIVHDWMKHPQF